MLKHKSKNLIILFIVTILFSACTQKIEGLTVEESKKHPVTMISTSKITCSNFLIEEGTIFVPQDVSDKKYTVAAGISPYATLFGTIPESSNKFPKKALFLNFDESSRNTMGLIIYPNGKFVYENYHIGLFNAIQNRWQLFSDISCKANSDTLFEMKMNKK